MMTIKSVDSLRKICIMLIIHLILVLSLSCIEKGTEQDSLNENSFVSQAIEQTQNTSFRFEVAEYTSRDDGNTWNLIQESGGEFIGDKYDYSYLLSQLDQLFLAPGRHHILTQFADGSWEEAIIFKPKPAIHEIYKRTSHEPEWEYRTLLGGGIPGGGSLEWEKLSDETISGVPCFHFALVTNSAYNYDFWIGKSDQLIRQQMSVTPYTDYSEKSRDGVSYYKIITTYDNFNQPFKIEAPL